MDAGGFVEWAWSLTDENKAALAERVARVRTGTDEHFLREARSSAEAAIATTGFDAHEANVAAAPDDALDEDGRDLEAWNRAIGDDLRAAYEDAMLALGAGTLSRLRTGYAMTAVATLATMSKTSSAAPVAMPVLGSAPAPVIRLGVSSILA
jgi:hypothetical protein